MRYGPARLLPIFSIFIMVFLTGCVDFSGGISVYYAAAGARGKVPGGHGTCTRVGGAIPFDPGKQRFSSSAPGKLRLSCKGAKSGKTRVEIQFHTVARIRISGPDSIADLGKRYYQVEALDARGETLLPGDHPAVQWTLPPGLKRAERSHFMPSSAELQDLSIPVLALSPGRATLSVTLFGHNAHKPITVTLPH